MNAEAAWPTWSPDRKKIAFNANRSKTNLEIYVNNSDGGTPRPLTAEASLDAKPSWSVDGNWIYFGSDRSGVLQIWKLPANGGPAVQVTHHGGDSPAVSPDGRFVYFAGLRQKAGVWRMPTNGGDEQPVLEDLPGAAQGRWVPARNGIYFAVQDKAGDILNFLDLRTGRTAQVARFGKRLGPASPLSLSPDQGWLLYAQIDESSVDLLMLENFQ
jgi:dipeptidyl aminopeptidase/acylaminoacyl peptidase